MKGEAEAKEIVQSLNIHFPQFYSITSNLERKGFIETRGGRPKRYRAVDPKEVMRREINRMKEDAEVVLKFVEELRNKPKVTGRPSIWITTGIQNILYNVNKIIEEARFDTTIIMHNKFVPDVTRSLVRKREEGIQTYLIVYPRPPEPDLMGRIKEIKRVRFFETCPFAILAVADCERALLAHGLPEALPLEERYGVVFIEPLMPTFLCESFFWQTWEHAKPLFPEEGLERFPKTFRSQRMALVEIRELLKRGEVTVRVKGRYVKTGRAFEGTGTVVGVTETEKLKNFALRLPSGNTVTIGGPYSTLEEVEAELITILKAA